MALPFIAAVAINVALTALSAILARRNKAAVRAEPLRVDPPTAGEPIPLIFGTVKVPLKVIAFYHYRAEPIYKKSRIFGSPALTVGKAQVCTRYWVQMAALVGHGPVSYRDLIVDGKSLVAADAITPPFSYSLWQPDGGAQTVDAPGLLGGDFGNGGVAGPVRVYFGDGTPTPDALTIFYAGGLDATATPDWRHYAYMVFDDVWIGNSPTLPPLHAVVTRAPQTPFGNNLTGMLFGDADSQDDASAAGILWEVLTHPALGLGLPPEALDQTSFANLAEWLRGYTDADSSFGLSFALDRATPAGQVVSDVLRVLDASLYTNPTTGRLAIWLHREPSDGRYGYASLASLTRIGPDVARSCEWTAPQPAEVCNQIEVKYVDRARGYITNTVSVKNDALIAAVGQVIPQTVELIGVSTEAMALRLGARELRQLTTPLGTATLVCDRRPAGLHEGKQFVLDWPAYGLADVVMRVISIDHGTQEDPSVTIEAVEDLYSFPEYEEDRVVSEPWTDPGEPAGFVVPVVEEETEIGDTTGTLTLTITDPQARVTLVEFITQTGRNAPSAWTPDASAPYSATVTLDPKHLSYIGWRVTYTLPGGDDDMLEGSVAFEADTSSPAEQVEPLLSRAAGEALYARGPGSPLYQRI